MSLCKLCNDDEVDAIGAAMAVCKSCRDKLGVKPMGPPRRTAPCARCNALEFIRVIPREHTAEPGMDSNYPQIAQMTATFAPVATPRTFGKTRFVTPGELPSGFGPFEIYICVACGFCDWYCTNPAEIPIGPEYMTDVVVLGPTTEYR